MVARGALRLGASLVLAAALCQARTWPCTGSKDSENETATYITPISPLYPLNPGMVPFSITPSGHESAIMVSVKEGPNPMQNVTVANYGQTDLQGQTPDIVYQHSFTDRPEWMSPPMVGSPDMYPTLLWNAIEGTPVGNGTAPNETVSGMWSTLLSKYMTVYSEDKNVVFKNTKGDYCQPNATASSKPFTMFGESYIAVPPSDATTRGLCGAGASPIPAILSIQMGRANSGFICTWETQAAADRVELLGGMFEGGEGLWKVVQDPEPPKYFIAPVTGFCNDPSTASLQLITIPSPSPNGYEMVGQPILTWVPYLIGSYDLLMVAVVAAPGCKDFTVYGINVGNSSAAKNDLVYTGKLPLPPMEDNQCGTAQLYTPRLDNCATLVVGDYICSIIRGDGFDKWGAPTCEKITWPEAFTPLPTSRGASMLSGYDLRTVGTTKQGKLAMVTHYWNIGTCFQVRFEAFHDIDAKPSQKLVFGSNNYWTDEIGWVCGEFSNSTIHTEAPSYTQQCLKLYDRTMYQPDHPRHNRL